MEKGIYIFSQYLLGIIFITSGVTKLLSIDDFQVFIYSLDILNLNNSMMLTRFIIGLELSIGLLFLFRLNSKLISYLTLGLMVIFTFFSLYLQISGSSDDCHCFGTIIQLSNTTTILKNIIIISMIIYLLIHKQEKHYKFKKLLLCCSFILGFGTSLAVRPPDFIYSTHYSKDSFYYKPSLVKFIVDHKLTDKKQIICFFSTSCKYCKLAAKKISIISEKTKNTDDILYVFWSSNSKPRDFFKDTKTTAFNYVNLDVIEFLKLTNGTMPLIILYNKGIVEKVFRYREIDEYQIIQFLDNNN